MLPESPGECQRGAWLSLGERVPQRPDKGPGVARDFHYKGDIPRASGGSQPERARPGRIIYCVPRRILKNAHYREGFAIEADLPPGGLA